MFKMSWKRYKRIAVYIDNANIIHSPSYLGWKISLQKLSLFFQQSKHLQSIRLFDSIPEKDDLDRLLRKRGFTKKDYDKYLKRSVTQKAFLEKAEKAWNISIHLKPLRFIYSKTKRGYVLKGDCDVDLTVDAIRKRKQYDTLFLLSGDGNYVALVNYLRQCKKRIAIVSTRGLIANILVKAAHEYIDFQKLKKNLSLKSNK